MIYSKRCIVRPFKEEDIEVFMAYHNQLSWMQYQGFKGLDKAAYTKQLLQSIEVEKGFQLAIVSKETKQLLGDIYLKKEHFTYWIGYTIQPSEARKGYAFEVLTTLFVVLKTKGIFFIKAAVEHNNIASIQLLRKLGFHYLGTIDEAEQYLLDLRKE